MYIFLYLWVRELRYLCMVVEHGWICTLRTSGSCQNGWITWNPPWAELLHSLTLVRPQYMGILLPFEIIFSSGCFSNSIPHQEVWSMICWLSWHPSPSWSCFFQLLLGGQDLTLVSWFLAMSMLPFGLSCGADVLSRCVACFCWPESCPKLFRPSWSSD